MEVELVWPAVGAVLLGAVVVVPVDEVLDVLGVVVVLVVSVDEFELADGAVVELLTLLSVGVLTAVLPDSIALEPVFLVVSATSSTSGLRQKSSQRTSHTSAANTSSDTIAQISLPTTDTRFSSYILHLSMLSLLVR